MAGLKGGALNAWLRGGGKTPAIPYEGFGQMGGNVPPSPFAEAPTLGEYIEGAKMPAQGPRMVPPAFQQMSGGGGGTGFLGMQSLEPPPAPPHPEVEGWRRAMAVRDFGRDVVRPPTPATPNFTIKSNVPAPLGLAEGARIQPVNPLTAELNALAQARAAEPVPPAFRPVGVLPEPPVRPDLTRMRNPIPPKPWSTPGIDMAEPFAGEADLRGVWRAPGINTAQPYAGEIAPAPGPADRMKSFMTEQRVLNDARTARNATNMAGMMGKAGEAAGAADSVAEGMSRAGAVGEEVAQATGGLGRALQAVAPVARVAGTVGRVAAPVMAAREYLDPNSTFRKVMDYGNKQVYDAYDQGGLPQAAGAFLREAPRTAVAAGYSLLGGDAGRAMIQNFGRGLMGNRAPAPAPQAPSAAAQAALSAERFTPGDLGPYQVARTQTVDLGDLPRRNTSGDNVMDARTQQMPQISMRQAMRIAAMQPKPMINPIQEAAYEALRRGTAARQAELAADKTMDPKKRAEMLQAIDDNFINKSIELTKGGIRDDLALQRLFGGGAQ